VKGQEIRPGQLVSSRAGRDRGRYYLVIGVVDERTVLVADGQVRRVANPKRKNPRHLVIHAAAAEALCRRLAEGASVDDGEVRRAVRMLASGIGCTDVAGDASGTGRMPGS